MEICFFRAEDGIRDRNVTGVKTCALPISFEIPLAVYRLRRSELHAAAAEALVIGGLVQAALDTRRRHFERVLTRNQVFNVERSEERRVGKMRRSHGWLDKVTS